jgi:hypothetical protein
MKTFKAKKGTFQERPFYSWNRDQRRTRLFDIFNGVRRGRNWDVQMSDGMTLTLSPGLQFTSDTPGFLSGGGTTPEPGTLQLLGASLLSLAALAWGKAKLFARATQPSGA